MRVEKSGFVPRAGKNLKQVVDRLNQFAPAVEEK